MHFLNRFRVPLLIFVFLTFVFGMGYTIYSIFFKPLIVSTPTNQNNTTSTSTVLGSLPQADQNNGEQIISSPPASQNTLPESEYKKQSTTTENKQNLTSTYNVSDSPALKPSVSNNNTLQYYNKSDGMFYMVDPGGNLHALSEQIFYNVENVVWSPKFNKAVLEYPDGSNIIYDFSLKQQITLPAHWKNFSFSRDGSQITAKSIGLDPSNRWLLVVNSDGTNARSIEDLGNNESKVYPNWSPSGQIAAFYTKGIDIDRQYIFFIGLNKENFPSAIIEGRGIEATWNPNGQKLLYSAHSTLSDNKPLLWVMDASPNTIGANRKRLNVETWASKCVFSSITDMYCAVPRSLPEGAGLLPDLAKETSDDIYKINIETGARQAVATLDKDYSFSDLTISGDEKFLYAIDNKTGILKKISLE